MIESSEFWPDLFDFYSIEKTVICLIGRSKYGTKEMVEYGGIVSLIKSGVSWYFKT